MTRQLWSFIVLVALFDVGFAVVHADTMSQWEANPAMLAVVTHLGVLVACAIRLATVMLACSLCVHCKSWVGKVGTAIVSAAHLYLAALYVAILWF